MEVAFKKEIQINGTGRKPRNKPMHLWAINLQQEKNMGRTLSDINYSNIFFNPSPRVMEAKRKQTNGT